MLKIYDINFPFNKEPKMLKIEKAPFGSALNPLTTKPVDIQQISLINNNNMKVNILTRGAVVQSIIYPDKFGNIADVCLGFDKIQDYIDHKNTYMGAIIGRVANRVSEGKFCLDDFEYSLTKNFKDKYQLNGGFNGFDSMIWDIIEEKANGITLQHINPDGMEGYPGQLTTTVKFTLDNNNMLGICLEALANKKTPVNLSNYLFLNLAGHNARKEGLFEHNILLKCNKIVECDQDQIPTGCVMPVRHTPYDLRKYVNFGKRLKKFFNHTIKGFDQNYCLDNCDGSVKPVAKVIHPCTGRFVEISCNQPTVQLLTCNDWPDIDKAGAIPIIGKAKAVYAQYGAFCLAPQGYPDAVNNLNFPSVMLEPKKKFCYKVLYRFGVCE
ncbi:galactose mutarotase-like [Cochliomyia hominivorax]